MELLLGLGVFMLLVVIIIYIAVAIFLNNFNKVVNGKGTALAWIPICNIYLLGKLTFNKMVGWILVACCFATGTFTVTINDVEKVYRLFPESIAPTVSNIYSLATFIILIIGIVKYNKLKNGQMPQVQQNPQMGVPTQPMQGQPNMPQQYPQQPNQPQPTQNMNNNQNNNMM